MSLNWTFFLLILPSKLIPQLTKFSWKFYAHGDFYLRVMQQIALAGQVSLHSQIYKVYRNFALCKTKRLKSVQMMGDCMSRIIVFSVTSKWEKIIRFSQYTSFLKKNKKMIFCYCEFLLNKEKWGVNKKKRNLDCFPLINFNVQL